MTDINAKILYNTQVGERCFRMSILAPDIAKNAYPGLFVMIKPWKCLDPLLMRPFSIHRINDNYIEILYMVVGKTTGMLSKMSAGQKLFIRGPLGKGFKVDKSKRTVFFVAGGIGVAPLIFLFEKYYLNQNNLFDDYQLYFFLGASTKDMLFCMDDLKHNSINTMLATDDGSKGFHGRITTFVEETIESEISPDMIYSCGPAPMLRALAGIALKHNIECQISVEEIMACGMGACLGCAVKLTSGEYVAACQKGPVFMAREIQWD